MFKIAVKNQGNEFVVSDNLLRVNDNVSDAVIASTNAKTTQAVKLADFPSSDLIIIDDARPNRDVLVKLHDVLNIHVENSANITSLKQSLYDNFERLKSINAYAPFQNVRLIVLRQIKKCIVIDKNVLSLPPELNENQRHQYAGLNLTSDTALTINKIVNEHAARLKGANKAIKALGIDHSESMIFDALAFCCDLHRYVKLPINENERLSLLKSTKIAKFAVGI